MTHNYHSRGFSKDGFQPLTGTISADMVNPRDVTIDIPMTQVPPPGPTGARKASPNPSPSTYQPPTDLPEPLDEKHAHFRNSVGGRRRNREKQDREDKDSRDGTLTAAGKLYKKVFNFSVVTRYFIFVAPLAMIIAIPIILGATAAQNAKIGGVRMDWFFTWIEIVWISLWVSKLVAQFLPYLFEFLCGVVSSGTRKYALVITALEIPLSLVGWSLTALTTFVPLMTLNPEQRAANDTSLTYWEGIVKDILFATFFSTLVLLVEKMIIQLISIGYHRKQFDDKIRQSKRNVYIVSLLYDASRSLFPAYCREFLEEDYTIADTLDLGASKVASHSRSGSATPMRIIQNVGRVGDKITAVFGNVAQEITGKQVFNPTSAHSVVVEALEHERSADALARRIWLSFVLEGQEALHHQDFADVLGDEHAAEAEEAFDCLDVDGNGDISLEEMVFRIREFRKERSTTSRSMQDVSQAISVLDNLLTVVVFIMVVFIFVAFLNKNFTTTLATTGTALLSLSFVFSVTAQEVLGSCIFLFVKHPFDVGDRVDIGGVSMVVERISLLYTIFRKVTDHKSTQVANIVLNTVWIDNISRSGAMREQISLFISFDTSLEDIQSLKEEMVKFVLDKENSRDFKPDIDIEVIGVAEMNKLELLVEVKHKSNWANEAVRAARRSKLMCALVQGLRRVPIYAPGGGGAPAGDPANPTYSVSISDDLAAVNRKKFADAKDMKRMVPISETIISPTTVKSPVIGKSSAIDYVGKSSTAANATSRKFAADTMSTSAGGGQESNFLLKAETQRSSDIEEVRGILRRESITGRRRAPSLPMTSLSPPRRTPTVNVLPTIITPPSTAVQPVPRQPPPGVGYYEDSGYKTTPLQEWSSEPTPSASTAAGSGVMSPPGENSTGRYVPGNAFSQERYQHPTGSSQRAPPPRPVAKDAASGNTAAGQGEA